MWNRKKRGGLYFMNKKDWQSVLQVVGQFAAEHKKTFACAIISAVLAAVRPFIPLVLMGMVLDAIVQGAAAETVIRYVLAVFGADLILELLESRTRQSFNQVNEYMKELEALKLNRKSLTMDYEYLEDIHVQELRMKGQEIFSWLGVTGNAIYNLESLLTAAVGTVTAVWILFPMLLESFRKGSGIYWIAAVLLFVFAGFLVWWDYRIGLKTVKKNKAIFNGIMSCENRMLYYMDLLAGAESQKDLRINHQQPVIEADMDSGIKQMRTAARECASLWMKKSWADQSASDLTGLLVYLFSAFLAVGGIITIGQVVTYASSIIRFSRAVANFANHIGHLKWTALFCRDQMEFMNLEKRKYEGTIPLEKRRDNKFKVSFEHVSFRYPGTDTDVIHDLNLEFTIGERMAIVGKNGSGKTTFIKLLCRLYDVTEGCIKVNGIDIRKYDYKEYCNLFSVVFQDFCMFAFPLGENIAAAETVDARRAEDALTRAGLGERLKRLSHGLDTHVGKEFDEDGVAFSGGEKQKMAIARAIYKDAPFVIMDEPTAALDPPSECEVYAGFDQMVGSKTALYISHRLASCRFCQDILVFDKGQVVQRGSHEELEKQEGLYRELWNAQAQYYV